MWTEEGQTHCGAFTGRIFHGWGWRGRMIKPMKYVHGARMSDLSYEKF